MEGAEEEEGSGLVGGGAWEGAALGASVAPPSLKSANFATSSFFVTKIAIVCLERKT